jgi:hypothetical protein
VTRFQRNNLAYLAIVIVSIALLWWAIPAYTPAWPGYGASPALVPNVAVGVMLAMAVLALARSALVYRRGRAMDPSESEYPADDASEGFTQVGRIRLLHVMRFLVPCALLIPGFHLAGFVPTSIAFLLLFQYLVGRRDAIGPVILALTVVAAMYAAMRYGFGVPVPGT